MATTKVGIEFDLYDRMSGGLTQIGAGIDDVTNKLERAPSNVESFGEGFGKLATKIGLVGVAISGLSSVASAGWDFAKGSVQAAAQVEGYKIALTTMLGTQDEANKRLAEYQDIAAKTPFELPQVVEAGNQLQALGRYSRENIEMLGDLAAASGKPIEQAMDAFAKMATGQRGEAVQQFRQLLISDDDWMKYTGKVKIASNGNREFTGTTEDMVRVLPQILKAKGFAGMMVAQSKSVAGGISNMKDSFFQLQAAIGERFTPEVKTATGMLTEFLTATKKLVEISPEERIRDEARYVNQLAGELANSNTPLERRREILKELQTLAPQIVAGLDAENLSYKNLADNIDKYNQKMVQSIILEKRKTKIGEIVEDQKEYLDDAAKQYSRIDNVISKAMTKAISLGDKNIIKELSAIIATPSYEDKAKKLGRLAIVSEDIPVRSTKKNSGLVPVSLTKVLFGDPGGSSEDAVRHPGKAHAENFMIWLNAAKRAEKGASGFDNAIAAEKKIVQAMETALLGTRPLPVVKEEIKGGTNIDDPNKLKEGINKEITSPGGGTSPVSAVGQGAGTATGGTTINVRSLVEKIEIHSSVKESIADIEDTVGRALLRLLNSANGR